MRTVPYRWRTDDRADEVVPCEKENQQYRGARKEKWNQQEQPPFRESPATYLHGRSIPSYVAGLSSLIR